MSHLPARYRKQIDKFIQASSLLYSRLAHAGTINKQEVVAMIWRDVYDATKNVWFHYDRMLTSERARRKHARSNQKKSKRRKAVKLTWNTKLPL